MPGRPVLDGLTLSVAPGEVVALVGPSGCGKTTALKLVNRLLEPDGGTIRVFGKPAGEEDPVALRRRIGYVIQEAGLFPHRTVEENVETVPRLLGWPAPRRRDRSEELLAMVGLPASEFARRYPRELSGGQRQRVGVARALAADPPVLLMDEPFGAVDPVVRGRLQEEFSRLQRELGKTVVFVTHDIDEAVLLGDRVAVFAEGGRLLQYDTPARLLARPVNDEVATFVGAERGLRRLSVTLIEHAHLEPVDGVKAAELASTVAVGATLEEALALMLRDDRAMVGVTDGPRFVGVLTPAGVHRALRESLKD